MPAVEELIKNAEKFQKELGLKKFYSSPYNSPEAQHARLKDARVEYLDRRARATRQIAYAALLFCLALFIYSTAPLALPSFVGWSVAAAIAGFFGYGVYLFRKDPPDDHYKCPHCDAPSLLHDPWVCGHCKTTHRPTLTSRKPPTWVEACSKCKNVPHSLFCCHCHMPSVFHQLNFFGCPTEGAYLEGHPPQPVKPNDDMEKRLEAILK
jgi:hypothetical protein